jgi:hypothetical protein
MMLIIFEVFKIDNIQGFSMIDDILNNTLYIESHINLITTFEINTVAILHLQIMKQAEKRQVILKFKNNLNIGRPLPE